MDPKSDPTRHCLKPEHWPEADRLAWAVAFHRGGLLDGGGAAAGWRPTTRKAVQDAYGRYLTFLARQGWLDAAAGPAERVTPDWLRAFIAALEPTVAPITLRNRIRDLSEALRVMAPGAAFPYLQRARARLKARSRPIRNKRQQIVPIRRLFALGVELIKRAEAEDAARALWNASLYRDGVMILILTCRPLRRRNVAAMLLGQHLVRRGDHYALQFDEDETKNRRPFEQPLAPELTPVIERYLEHYRPKLLGQNTNEHVWISWRGKPLTDAVIYASLVARTKKAFGFAVPPHRFRDSVVTSLCEDHPDQIWLAATLLHHTDHRAAEKHYNQAQDVSAVRAWQEHVATRRKAARRSGRF